MAVYWIKYKSKPSGKVLTYVASNRKLVEQVRKERMKAGFKCTPISKSYGQGATIWGHKVGK